MDKAREDKVPFLERSKDFLLNNMVTVMFAVLSVGAYFAAKVTPAYVLNEMFTRFGRNTCLVLSLVVPVACGLGLNFGIVVGAMAAQIGVFAVSAVEMTGFSSMLVCILITTPIAVLFGYCAGLLFNRMRGSEMIGGMVLRYCADGLYQLLFLFVFGGLIKIDNNRLMIMGGVGVKNTIDLKGSLGYAIDELPLLRTLEIALAAVLIIQVYNLMTAAKQSREHKRKQYIVNIALCVGVYGVTWVPYFSTMLTQTRWSLLTAVEGLCFFGIAYLIIGAVYAKIFYSKPFHFLRLGVQGGVLVALYLVTYVDSVYRIFLQVKVPVTTYLVVGGFCAINAALFKTQLGQNMRTVGQGASVAASAGINVDKTRIIAVILSTVLAAWGQLISLQNIGTLQTYGAHDTVGQFSIAALLVGGASVQRATNTHALLGVLLFHTLFVLSPPAGAQLFGDPVIGENFRVFLAYGVIALALAMHAWKVGPKQQVRRARTESKPPSQTEEGVAESAS